jgi:hypothetical protein
MRSGSLVLVLALALAGCAVTGERSPMPDCRELSGSPSLIATFYFGRDAVADAAWDDFLAATVTPRFPDGLTVMDGTGQWLNPQTRQIAHERTKILVIATERSPATLRKIDEIRNAYKSRFHQLSVGLVLSEGCADF